MGFLEVLSIASIAPFMGIVVDPNIIYTNKSRSSYSLIVDVNLPLLKNDTDNIIIYKNDLEEFKKKRKKRFWEKLISNKNE